MRYQDVRERRGPEVKVTMPTDLLPILYRYGKRRKEHFVVVTLDGGQQVIKVHLITVGLANRSLVHPREVFYPAIRDNAVAVVLVHNHPSGSLDPSREDLEATRRLVDAGKLLGIEVLDHLIIGPGTGFLSFKEERLVFL